MTKKQYHGIMIDESRTDSLEEYSKYLIKSHYSKDDETIQEAIARAAICWGSNLEHAQRLYDYASDGWFMFASPPFANAILPGQKPKALPISCFLPYVPDDVPGLIFQKAEFALLSVMGGGIGQYWGDVRPVSKKAPGPIPFIHENDGGVLAWKQGTTRRGALAAYLNVQHPDAPEFLKIRVPTGDSDRKSLNIHNAFNIPDSFMEAVERGDETYPLINPSNGKQEGEVDPRSFWREIVEVRGRTGEPFMYFVDTANRALPLPQKMLGLKTHASNLCTEITLAADRNRTPVCCLSSVNAEKFPEWKDHPHFISDLVEALDNILTFFIENVDNIAENYEHEFDRVLIRTLLSKVKYSASRERSIGLGVMGYHYYLQRMGVPFESEEAMRLNDQLFSQIKNQAHEASVKLGKERGVPPDITDYIAKCKEEGIPVDPYWEHRRNLHLLANAPNANNSVILATSPSTELMLANIYTQEMRIGQFVVKNRYLKQLLASKGKDTAETWDKIADDGGSVVGLDFLTEREKQVYKTAMEINQEWVIRHAAGRQKHICQAQSTNLFFPPGSDINYVLRVHYQAWKAGVKSLYYYRTETDAKIERVTKEVEREVIEEVKKTIVYGTPTCQQCAAAKALFTANNIEFEYVDLMALGKTAAEVTGRPVRSVPQVYIHGEWIGGLKEVMAYLTAHQAEPESSEECVSCQG